MCHPYFFMCAAVRQLGAAFFVSISFVLSWAWFHTEVTDSVVPDGTLCGCALRGYNDDDLAVYKR
jgi:hypothetical protein